MRIYYVYLLITMQALQCTTPQHRKTSLDIWHILQTGKTAALEQFQRYKTPLIIEAASFCIGGTAAYLIGRNDCIQQTVQHHPYATRAIFATMIGASMLTGKYTFDALNDLRMQRQSTSQLRTCRIYAGSCTSGLLTGLAAGGYLAHLR